MEGKCAVCGQPGHKRRGYKRALCRECARAADMFTGYSEKWQRGWLEGASETPHLASPEDGNLDTYESKNRRRME